METPDTQEKEELAGEKILKVLFLSSAPLSSYQIAKKARISQAASHEILEKMLEEGLVKIARAEKYRTNLEAKYYTLTKKGLEKALEEIDLDRVPLEDVEKALDYWAETMPDVRALSWWRVFRSGSELAKRFYVSCLSESGLFVPEFVVCALSSLADKIVGMSAEEVFSMDLIYTAQFISIWYDFMGRLKPEELQRMREELSQLVKRDDEARKEVIETLKEYLKEHQETITDIERLLSLLQK